MYKGPLEDLNMMEVVVSATFLMITIVFTLIARARILKE